MNTTLTSPKTKPSPSVHRDERLWELFALVFGHLHAKVEFEFPHPDGGGMCFADAKELRERCEEISQLAMYSARYGCGVFDEQTAVETFNEKLGK